MVYALHGYSIGAEQWSHEIHVPQTIEGSFAQGAKEFIVVLPDSKTIYNGSMYSSSATTGDFENFIAHDVVNYMEAHDRTIPNRLSRGLVVHSMGGYGASRERESAVPLWVKAGIDDWLAEAESVEGRIFRSVAKNGRVSRSSLSDWAVWSIVQRSAEEFGLKRLGAPDLGGTCANFCR